MYNYYLLFFYLILETYLSSLDLIFDTVEKKNSTPSNHLVSFLLSLKQQNFINTCSITLDFLYFSTSLHFVLN